MNALYFIVKAVLDFAVYAFLLRLLLQFVRVEFRNPLVQAVVALTSWLVVPLRRVLPPIGRFDTASLVALLIVQFVSGLVLYKLSYGYLAQFGALAVWTIQQLLLAAIALYTFVIFVGALLSLLAPGSRSPASQILDALSEPVLRPIRAFLPLLGGLDFSPFVAILGLQALRLLIA